jgi:chromosome condensin MukBEF complex kleisin-like MukF subunit
MKKKIHKWSRIIFSKIKYILNNFFKKTSIYKRLNKKNKKKQKGGINWNIN